MSDAGGTVDRSRAQRLALFIAISFGGSWALAATFAAVGGSWASAEGRAVWVLNMLPPAIAALVVQGPFSKLPLVEPLALRPRLNRWLAIGWMLLPIVILGVGLGLAALAGFEIVTGQEQYVEQLRQMAAEAGQLEQFEERAAESAPPHPLRLVFDGVLAGVINGFLVLGQELGWRGFLFAEVPGSFWRRSGVVGLVWGAWHVPFVLQGQLYPEHTGAGVALIFAWCLVMSPLLAYVRLRSRWVVTAALMHGTIISLTPVAHQLVVGRDDRLEPFHGLLGIAAAALVLAALVAWDRTLAAQPLLRRREPRDGRGEPAND